MSKQKVIMLKKGVSSVKILQCDTTEEYKKHNNSSGHADRVWRHHLFLKKKNFKLHIQAINIFFDK
jgi:transposase-like protein